MKNNGRSKNGWFSSRSRRARALRFWASFARWCRRRISSALLVREDSIPFVRLEFTGRYSPSNFDKGKVSLDLRKWRTFSIKNEPLIDCTNIWMTSFCDSCYVIHAILKDSLAYHKSSVNSRLQHFRRQLYQGWMGFMTKLLRTLF